MPLLSFRFKSSAVASQAALELRQLDLRLLRRIASSETAQVDPGSYLVIVRLPGGRQLDKQINIVGSSSPQTVEFDLGDMADLNARAGYKTLFYPAFSHRTSIALSQPGIRPLHATEESTDAGQYPFLGHARVVIHTFNTSECRWDSLEEWPRAKPLPSHLEFAFRPNQLKIARIEPSEGGPLYVALPGYFLVPATLEFAQSARGELIAVAHPFNRWADELLEYLRSSELAEAAALANPWVDVASDLLAGKKEDPIAAVIGAYALLRIGAIGRLGDWTNLLVKYRKWLPDALIVRIEHLGRLGKDYEANQELLQLPDGWTPIFTDGLRYAVERFRWCNDVSLLPPQATRLYRRVQRLAAMADPRQPILTVRGGLVEQLLKITQHSSVWKEQPMLQQPDQNEASNGFPPVIGRWPTDDAVARLRELGAEEKAGELEAFEARSAAEAQGPVWDWMKSLFETPAYKHTSHSVGYIENIPTGTTTPIDVQDAGTIAADNSLRDQRITLSLMSLRTWNYPGHGTHNILLNFEARNQAPDGAEPVAFNLSAQSRDGQQAGVLNYPIFVGLKVGKEGVAFEGRTVNVSNDADKTVLDVMDSDLFRSGLQLLETAQPVIKPFTSLGVGLARAMAKRNENIPVQFFKLGLDFSQTAMGTRLRTGLYLIAQVPEARVGQKGMDWNDWVYLPSQRTIARRTNHVQPLPVNFVAIGVRRATI
jgi:hypothetical protein